MEFLEEIPISSSHLQSHDFKKLSFVTQFSQSDDPSLPGAYRA